MNHLPGSRSQARWQFKRLISCTASTLISWACWSSLWRFQTRTWTPYAASTTQTPKRSSPKSLTLLIQWVGRLHWRLRVSVVNAFDQLVSRNRKVLHRSWHSWAAWWRWNRRVQRAWSAQFRDQEFQVCRPKLLVESGRTRQREPIPGGAGQGRLRWQ